MAAAASSILRGIFRRLSRAAARRAARRITPTRYGSASRFISAVRNAGGSGGNSRLRVFWKAENNRTFTGREITGEWGWLQRNYPETLVDVSYNVRQTNTYRLQGRPSSERRITIDDDPSFTIEIGDGERNLRTTVEQDWDNRKNDEYDDEILRELYGRGAGYGRIVAEGSARISDIRVI